MLFYNTYITGTTAYGGVMVHLFKSRLNLKKDIQTQVTDFKSKDFVLPCLLVRKSFVMDLKIHP